MNSGFPLEFTLGLRGAQTLVRGQAGNSIQRECYAALGFLPLVPSRLSR
jgi:hypothetical protein